jgi:hypothetical protein
VVQAILASRSVLFEVVFRGLAVIALLAAGFLLGDVALKVLGFLMLAGMPVAWKLARITGELRDADLSRCRPTKTGSPPPRPRSSARWRKRSQAREHAPTRAALAHVFEALNARPPRLVASFGLAAVQLVSLLGAVVFTVALAVGQSTSLGNLMQAAAALPTTTLDLTRSRSGTRRSPSRRLRLLTT